MFSSKLILAFEMNLEKILIAYLDANAEIKPKKAFEQSIVTSCNIKVITFTFVGEFATAFDNAVIPFIVRLAS